MYFGRTGVVDFIKKWGKNGAQDPLLSVLERGGGGALRRLRSGGGGGSGF